MTIQDEGDKVSKAVVLSAGFGKRLLSVTEETPKAMVRIAGRPVLEFILRRLSAHGFKEVVLAVLQRDRRSINDYFGDGSHFGIKLDYLESDGSRSTAGHIWEMRSSLKETFLVHYGDIITNLDLTEALSFHRLKESEATICLIRENNIRLPFGVAALDDNLRVARFEEKPRFGGLVNAAIYFLEPSFLKYLEGNLDFGADIFPAVCSGCKMYGYVSDAYWYNINSISDYDELKRLVSEGFIRLDGHTGHDRAPVDRDRP